MEKTALSNKVIYRIVVWALLAISVVFLIRIAPALYKPELLPSDDFVPFWAGGRLNIHGENPYEPQNIERLQVEAGGQPSGAYTISIMLNPPWAISMVMPLGLLDYQVGRFVWLILSVTVILISALLLWRSYSGNPAQRWLAILVVFLCAPVISVLEVGQITAIVLVGIAGFLYFAITHPNDWLAGAFLVLALIKPQVAFLFWMALILWVVQQRRWLILVSAGVITLVLTLIAFIFNPHIMQQYLVALQTYQISDWANPTIGSYLRYFWLGTEQYWLQFVAPVLGVAWLLFHWYRQHKTWAWTSELPALLLVSLITTPYTWTYDQVILLPVFISATILIIPRWKSWTTFILGIVYLVINLLDLLLHTKLSDFWFIWLAPAFLAWFLLVRWQYSVPKNKSVIMVSEA